MRIFVLNIYHLRNTFQEFYTIPGFDKVFNGASALQLHNLAVEQGALQQVSLWVHLIETVTGVPALIQVHRAWRALT